jgi:hypothetical protein
MSPKVIDRLTVAFWIGYIALPFLTGILAYHWLPNESYDASYHDLILNREVQDRNGDSVDAPAMWADKRTGVVYTYGQFRGHRHSEAIRCALVWFGYGLIGCVVATYSNRSRGLWKAFRLALVVDGAIAGYIFISTWS